MTSMFFRDLLDTFGISSYRGNQLDTHSREMTSVFFRDLLDTFGISGYRGNQLDADSRSWHCRHFGSLRGSDTSVLPGDFDSATSSRSILPPIPRFLAMRRRTGQVQAVCGRAAAENLLCSLRARLYRRAQTILAKLGRAASDNDGKVGRTHVRSW
jgi:hypothetical protein